MTARLQVGNQFGRLLTELEVDISSISWRLNNVGKMTFDIAKTDSKLTLDNLAYGNLALVEFDNGLPDWGGVIDPPRDWGDEAVGITTYSGEKLLGTRQTDEGRYFDGATVGGIFQKVIQEAHADRPLPISIGEIWGGGEGHSPEYHLKDLLYIARDSLCGRLSTADFDLSPRINSGAIGFMANFYERKGSDKPGVALIEGHNLTDIRLKEQGTIVNSWDLAGEGSSWDADVRLLSYKEDLDSIARYGLRQDSKIFSDVSIQGTLDTHAENLLAESKDPHNMLELTAINLVPALFSDYDVGDSVMVQLTSFGFGGFEGLVRVLGREYEAKTDTCKLVVREVA